MPLTHVVARHAPFAVHYYLCSRCGGSDRLVARFGPTGAWLCIPCLCDAIAQVSLTTVQVVPYSQAAADDSHGEDR